MQTKIANLTTGYRAISFIGEGFWRDLFNFRTARSGLLVFLGYYFGARLGLALTFHPHPVSVMWPPNSILLGALLLSPPRIWWLMLLYAFPAHLLSEMQGDIPIRMILCWFVSNSAEALIGAAGTVLLLGPTPKFDRMKSIGILFIWGALLGPFFSSFLDSAFVWLNRFGNQGYWEVWNMRFLSNAFTSLTLLPVIVIWGRDLSQTFSKLSLKRLGEGAVLTFGLLATVIAVFVLREAGSTTIPALFYVPLPFLVWAAVRFESNGASASVLLMALLAIWAAIHGQGPFASDAPDRNAHSIQVFFGVISVTLMFLATAVTDHRKTEERFAKAFHFGPIAMLIKRSKSGQIIEVNQKWEEMFGYPRVEAIGRSVRDLNIYLTDMDRERFLAETSVQHSLHDVELCLRTKTRGLCHTSISSVAVDIGGERSLITIFRDITDRKRAEEAHRNLAHVSRLAVMGELTAMVAHEINQPLGAILSNTDAAEMLLELDDPPLEEIRQILGDIRKNDLRADEAIKRIRALLRKRETEMQSLDLNETIVDGLRLVAGDALRRRVLIQRDLTANLPPVYADRVHLQQVLLNLLVNGMDAMNDRPESSRRIVVHSKRSGDQEVEVIVTDWGGGVPPDRTTHIFESFFTTKKDGMGLGLSIARSILDAHRGRIWVENAPHGGAAFHFTLQLAGSGT